MNKYCFLTIEELVGQEGKRRVSLITKNESGDLLFERGTPDEPVTEYCESPIRTEDVDEDKGKQKRNIALTVYNSKGEEVGRVRFTEIGDERPKDSQGHYLDQERERQGARRR